LNLPIRNEPKMKMIALISRLNKPSYTDILAALPLFSLQALF